MPRESLTIAAARYALGLLPGAAIPAIADDALNRGLHSFELAELAGRARERHPILSEVGPLFERALMAAGIPIPSKPAAAWIVLADVLGRVAERKVAPRDGVREAIEIHDVVQPLLHRPVHRQEPTEEYLGEEHGLHHLIGCFYAKDELDERPDEVSFAGKSGAAALEALDDELVRLAGEWVRSYGRFGMNAERK